jgi:hypothetical protein
MPVNVIGTLKPKNNGKFPVAEAVDIKVTDDLRLDEALENKADLSSVNFALDNKADKTTTTSLQSQINEIITPVTQDAEVQNARVGADGTTYNTLKARLDSENNFLKSHISDFGKLFNGFEESSWVVGNITATGEYDNSSSYNNYTTKYIISDNTKKVSVWIGEDRQVSIAKYDKDTGAFVSRINWTNDSLTLDGTYNYAFKEMG